MGTTVSYWPGGNHCWSPDDCWPQVRGSLPSFELSIQGSKTFFFLALKDFPEASRVLNILTQASETCYFSRTKNGWQ